MQLIFNPDAGGKDFAARATDGGLASMVMQSISMCDKVWDEFFSKYNRETITRLSIQIDRLATLRKTGSFRAQLHPPRAYCKRVKHT